MDHFGMTINVKKNYNKIGKGVSLNTWGISSKRMVIVKM